MSEAIDSIGYAGLGIMGAPMAGNLLAAGYPVTVWNRSPEKTRTLAEKGAAVVDCPRDLAASGADALFLNLTDTSAVEEVVFGDEGLLRGASNGQLVVDNSTIDPLATQRFAERAAEHGVAWVDAPVSGGDVGAKNGTLAIMAGGEAEALERVRPGLEVLGSAVTHVGEAGMGQACKACNQVAVACNLMGACESLALAKRMGLDPEKMIEVVSSGAGGSWQLANLGPKIVHGDHDPGFMVELFLKDLGIVDETARALRLALTGTSVAEGYFRSVAAEGGEKLGTQAMAKALEKLGGFRFDSSGDERNTG